MDLLAALMLEANYFMQLIVANEICKALLTTLNTKAMLAVELNGKVIVVRRAVFLHLNLVCVTDGAIIHFSCHIAA